MFISHCYLQFQICACPSEVSSIAFISEYTRAQSGKVRQSLLSSFSPHGKVFDGFAVSAHFNICKSWLQKWNSQRFPILTFRVGDFFLIIFNRCFRLRMVVMIGFNGGRWELKEKNKSSSSSFDEWLVFCNKLVMAAADLVATIHSTLRSCKVAKDKLL